MRDNNLSKNHQRILEALKQAGDELRPRLLQGRRPRSANPADGFEYFGWWDNAAIIQQQTQRSDIDQDEAA